MYQHSFVRPNNSSTEFSFVRPYNAQTHVFEACEATLLTNTAFYRSISTPTKPNKTTVQLWDDS